MPNGKIFRPYRLPGRYCCTVCRDLKDAEEFYKDSSRYNGCASRCKDCEKKRGRTRHRWTEFEVKKRAEEIKATLPENGVSRENPENLFFTCSRKDGRSGIVQYFDDEGNVYAKRGIQK